VSRNACWTALLVALFVASELTVPSAAMGQAATDVTPVVSLAEARRRATSVDPNAVAARGQIATAAWERRAAVADVITPRLTAGGSYTHSPDSVFNFGTFGLSRTATSATLQASYTVLGAGKLGALRSSRASVESAEASETAVRFRTALAADAAYFAVLADRELSRVAADRLRRAEEQFGIARVRVLAGEAIAPDSLQLLLEVNRARLAVLSRDSALVTSRLRLGRQIGLSGPADAEPVDTAVPSPLPMTQEQAISEMRARGPDLEAARAAERRADAIVLAERETYLPTITVGVQRAAYDRELFPEQTFRTEYAVTVSFPIWNAGQRELAVARARVDRDVARSQRQDRERGAAEEIAQAYHGYLTSRAGIELAQIGVAASSENFRVQSARYREGATTILDLLEAQVALSEAEAALVQSRYSTRLALAQIEALLGRRIFEASTTDRN
jgi:outer membrane protein TolC